MRETFLLIIRKDKLKTFLASAVFVGFSIWFYFIHRLSLDSTADVRQLWASLYQVMAIFGAITGIFVSRHWDGYRSIVGRVILAFSLGLLFQSFGQSSYSYYIFFKHAEVPYPSIGDVGFLSSTICYIFSAFFLAKLSGLKFSLKSLKGKILALLIPLGVLILFYFSFLQGYEFDWSNKLKILIDFGNPFCDALYLSITLLTFLLSRDFLGGIMRKPIFFLLIALVFQCIADFMFLYQASRGTWYVGGLNDYMYFISYFLMTIGLIYMGSIFQKIKES
jgi:hypothetical protein